MNHDTKIVEKIKYRHMDMDELVLQNTGIIKDAVIGMRKSKKSRVLE